LSSLFSSGTFYSKKELISLRIDEQILNHAKSLAARQGVGYQSILRGWIEKSVSIYSL
jgi:predicted DNA binding CopG/RHH family protein